MALTAYTLIAAFTGACVSRSTRELQLRVAASDGDLGQVQTLLARDAALNSEAALFRAAEKGHTEIVKYLLDHGAGGAIRVSADRRTPLHAAASAGHIEAVALLIERGVAVEIEARIKGGMTVLALAADQGHAEIVQLLLDSGADVDAVDYVDNYTPLSRAAAQGHAEIVKQLLKSGATPNGHNYPGSNTRTPLQLAAEHNHMQICEMLLERGAAVDAMTGSLLKRSPLHWAAANGNLELCALLLDNGAAINAFDSSGHTPLSLLMIRGANPPLVSLLKEHGADPKLGPRKSGESGASGGYTVVATSATYDERGKPILASQSEALYHSSGTLAELKSQILFENPEAVETQEGTFLIGKAKGFVTIPASPPARELRINLEEGITLEQFLALTNQSSIPVKRIADNIFEAGAYRLLFRDSHLLWIVRVP